MIQVKLASKEEVICSRDKWNLLVESMKFPTIFLTWEWISSWLNQFGSLYKPFILFLYDKNELVGICPLARKVMKHPGGLLAAKTMVFCGSIELFPNHLDIICEKQNAHDCVKKTFEYLFSMQAEWDILYFCNLYHDGMMKCYLDSIHYDKRIRLVNSSQVLLISTIGTIDSFIKSFHSKKRYSIKSRRKKLIEKKGISFKKIMNQNKLDEEIEKIFDIHEQRSVQKGIVSTFQGNEIINFHKDIARLFSENGWIRLYGLKDNDKTIAFAYCFVFNKRLYFYQTAFAPEWRSYAPGKILILLILEDIFNDEIVEFDFLMGHEDYKTFWTTEFRNNSTFHIYGGSIKGKLIRCVDIAKYYIKRFMGKI